MLSWYPVSLPLAMTFWFSHEDPPLSHSLLCDLGQFAFPRRLLDKHFTATSPGRNWNRSDSPLSLLFSTFSQSLQICILHSFIHMAEYGAFTAPKFYCYSPFLTQAPTRYLYIPIPKEILTSTYISTMGPSSYCQECRSLY